jgi:SAM-dependent methyltransferase
MDFNALDWNKIWKEQKERRTSPARDARFWNRRSPSFSKHAPTTGYAEAFLKIMKPHRTWKVLDMGCGSGTLSIPLAVKVREITAVDFSEKMLAILREQSDRREITNIKTIHARWEDDWDRVGIGVHDVAIASRSLVVDDLQGAIMKLNHVARKRVYISTIVGDGPFDRRIFEALGRKFVTGPDYIYNYNLLYQMGIHANVTFIFEKNTKIFESHEAALNSFKWMLEEMSRKEEDRLMEYLREHLVRHNGKWMLNYKIPVRWAVIWWKKGNLSE